MLMREEKEKEKISRQFGLQLVHPPLCSESLVAPVADSREFDAVTPASLLVTGSPGQKDWIPCHHDNVL